MKNKVKENNPVLYLVIMSIANLIDKIATNELVELVCSLVVCISIILAVKSIKNLMKMMDIKSVKY